MSVPLRAVQLTEPSLFLQEHPEVQFVDLLISDMNGVVRGKRIERNSLPKVFEKGINLPASLFALDITGSTVESTGLGLDIGDADRICYPIPGTLSMEPWQKRPTAQLLMTMHELEGDPFFADPREVLRQVVARFTEMELTIVAAFELEFYLIDQENVNGRPQPPRSPISGKRPQSVQVYSIDDLDEYVECLQDIIDGARAQGIPADAIVAESAPAQFEVNLHHVADPMKACDYAVLLKRLIKNIAYDHEMDTTFMAKPYPGQAGNGLHVHISLLDKHGNNIFTSEDPEQNAALRHAIGGVLETLPASMAFLCPNVNSYRRFGSQFYVPNAPSWGEQGSGEIDTFFEDFVQTVAFDPLAANHAIHVCNKEVDELDLGMFLEELARFSELNGTLGYRHDATPFLLKISIMRGVGYESIRKPVGCQ